MHKAELYMLNNRISTMETRLNDPIRDIKNYTIILKTVLRLAAEQGKVHPGNHFRSKWITATDGYGQRILSVSQKT